MADTLNINVFGNASEGNISVAAGGGYTIQEISQADYDALTTKSATTLYIITS